jgi:D-arabinono-1,4-lactone oxidase
MNLDCYADVLGLDEEKSVVKVQAGIRLKDLNEWAAERGLTMPNLGSIDEQSVAGCIATGTHGSSIRHGLLSEDVVALRIVLGNGAVVWCDGQRNPDLFRAALVSLGALGVVVEVEYRLVAATNIAWVQSVKRLDYVLETWNAGLWTQAEFTRVWWLPYTARAVVWHADKTAAPCKLSNHGWYGSAVGHHTYHVLLWLAQYVPWLVPWIEWFVMGMQHGFKLDSTTSGVEEQRNGLLLNCLYSQFVNEWALPLSRGPEAITRLAAWLHGDEQRSGIPFSSKGIYVHCPIEVRVSDTVRKEAGPTPYLDYSCRTEPTLYLNAIMYRPYGLEPPSTERYYQAFEWLMQDLGGKPHWAKNFLTVGRKELEGIYRRDLTEWRKVRKEVDPEGVFAGEWLRRNVLEDNERGRCEEMEVLRRKRRSQGTEWIGRQAFEVNASLLRSSSRSSESSFDVLASAEAEVSTLFDEYSDDGESTDGNGCGEDRVGNVSMTGAPAVFEKT